MKIVIDIDNETYARIQALVNADYFEHDICGYSMQRIANGTPYEDRPQGEWIECTKSGMSLTEYGRMTGEKWYGFKCSQCNFIYKGNALIDSPFCQKCGADMRKDVK